MLVENQHKESLVSQRQVYVAVLGAGGIASQLWKLTSLCYSSYAVLTAGIGTGLRRNK